MTAPTGAAPPAAAGPRPAAISAEKLLLAHGRVPVVRDLSVELPAGARVALLGANGSGKSTLLAALAALSAPRGGTLRVLGHALPDERWEVRGRVGLLAHHPLLYRELTIRENLHYHAALLGLPAARAEELLQRTELGARAGQPVGALSRGLTQRAAVARALLADPPLLLLDEPLANLDPAAAAIVGELLAIPPAVRASELPGRAEQTQTLGDPRGEAEREDEPVRRTAVTASHDPERALAESTHAIVLGPRAQVRHAGPVAGLTVAEVEAMYR